MKKLSVFVVVMMLAVGAFAASNEVTSVNAVGFVRHVVEDGEFALSSLPFAKLDGTVGMTIPEILPDAPAGSAVFFYDGLAWKQLSKVGTSWLPPNLATNEFIRGDALFIKAPNSGGPHTFTIMGEVPGELRTGTETPMLLSAGFTLAGFPYPTDMALSEAVLSSYAVSGDALFYWEDQIWKQISRVGTSWLPPIPGGLVIPAGEAYFYRANSGDLVFSETKPYMWP